MTTDKYGLHTIDYSVQGWDTIMSGDMETIDDVLHTNLLATLGETVSQYDAVGIFIGETKYKKAQDGTHDVPALGLALVSGVLNDEINVQRVGPVTNGSWSWTPGRAVYLSASVAGGLTHTRGRQYMGTAISSTTIILSGTIERHALLTTTTTV